MKKLLTLVGAVLLLSLTILPATAATDAVQVRIEGISATLYSGDVSIGEAKTVAQLLTALDAGRDDLTITGLGGGYVAAVNGETAATFGGWDGWLFTVNSVEPAVGMGEATVKAGDRVVLYYGDPFGVGMQYPALTLADGVLTLTSKDTTYDAAYNATVTVNPVAGATVTWYVAGQAHTYTSDAAGKVTLPQEVRTAGDHRVTVAKVAANGLPLVLRVDATLNIPAPATTPTTSATATSPQTGAAGGGALLTLSVAALAVPLLAKRCARER